MSTKLSEITEPLPSVPPPSNLHGSGILSQFSSPSMASSGILIPPKLMMVTRKLKFLILLVLNVWQRERIVFKLQSQVFKMPLLLYWEEAMSLYCDELDGEEVEVVPNSAGHPSNNSPSQPPAKRFQSQVIPSTPKTFKPTLATIPPASPDSSHTRPSLNPEVIPSPSKNPETHP
ncbi:hypothetical protein O181_110908 [Austropuccinia psidii MF-1]|uniref:Uncharacterized protein n=1 Tax=Austropuccinia psidii MF-1 TaxID=1389203 RepID=A0A9Q3JXK9_9BASI|nr:hypothetical protein [Austropuccinia psidii MF-1]